MAHFVVTERHGKRCYAVEFFYSPVKVDGSKRWPQPIEAIEINDRLAQYPMDDLINLYERGIRPKRRIEPANVAAPIALPQPRNLLAMG